MELGDSCNLPCWWLHTRPGRIHIAHTTRNSLLPVSMSFKDLNKHFVFEIMFSLPLVWGLQALSATANFQISRFPALVIGVPNWVTAETMIPCIHGPSIISQTCLSLARLFFSASRAADDNSKHPPVAESNAQSSSASRSGYRAFLRLPRPIAH